MNDRIRMRQECVRCGCEEGYIVTRGGQDCVHCEVCRKWQYNAPRTETGRAVRTIARTHSAVTVKVRAKVLLRAKGQCELCGADGVGGLHVGHLVSVKDGHAKCWLDVQINHQSNLCAMCPACNLGLGQSSVPEDIAVRIRQRWESA